MMKRSVFTMAVAALLVASMTMTAEAQRGGRGGQQGGQQGGRGGQQGGRGGPGGMMFGGGGMSLLQLAQIDAVQKEILADKETIEKISKLAEELRGERPDMSGFRDMSEEERTKAMEKMQKDRADRAKKGDAALAKILIEPQMDRLREIQIQLMGVNALVTDAVVAKLKIGPKKAKIEAAIQANQEGMREKMMAIFQGGDRENMREKMTELRTESDAKVLALLSADEKKAFEAMKGDKFEMPQGQRGGPGAQGGQRGQRGGDQGGDQPQRKQRPGV